MLAIHSMKTLSAHLWIELKRPVSLTCAAVCSLCPLAVSAALLPQPSPTHRSVSATSSERFIKPSQSRFFIVKLLDELPEFAIRCVLLLFLLPLLLVEPVLALKPLSREATPPPPRRTYVTPSSQWD